MLSADEVEELNLTIQQLDKDEVVCRLRQIKCRFPIDFTPEFFAKQSANQLRHILFGLCLHNRKTLHVSIAA